MKKDLSACVPRLSVILVSVDTCLYVLTHKERREGISIERIC